MNIDKPLCNLKTCRYCHDYNCFGDYERCEYTLSKRPHGEWKPYTTIDGYTKHATCTNCGYKRKVGIGCSLDEKNLPKFCEGCGADMRINRRKDPKRKNRKK